MQISSGFAVTDVGDVVKFKDTPKMAALREILEQVAGEHKVVVWTVWKSTYRDVERVLQDMGLGYRMLTGETKAGERDEVVDAFRKDPAVRVLIGNPHAAGIGINLTESSYSIFYSRNFSLGDYLQAEARNYRGGSEMHQKITHVDLITEGTIDEAITEKLLAKQEITENTLREVKNAI
jgi:SNF2 family DNA or RNA helicase